MSKVVKVKIIDKNTLVLEEDALKDDTIDLLSLSEVDFTHIEKRIEQGTDEIYNKKLKEVKKNLEDQKQVEIENAKLNAVKEVNERNNKLQTELNVLEEKLQLKYEKELLEKTNTLQKELDSLKMSLENEKKTIMLAKDEEYKEKINQLEEEKRRLTLEKSSLSVKMMGEKLEHWCENEYNDRAVTGFLNCTFEKDNKSIKEDDEIKGSKADYIFKVYADSKFLEKELLTSVVCEMKSEDPTSKIKHKNADHYKKLDNDRKKKNCEYALLVSELEWNDANDVPIRKVREYDKMYVVRPQYFITFLNLITTLATKYQELILTKEREVQEFKDAESILAEFEDMKKSLLDKPIAKIEKELLEIGKQREIITDAATKIAASTSKLTDTLIEDIKKKIENFNIKKITKKIDKM